MSELITSDYRKSAIENFALQLIGGGNGKKLMDENQEILSAVTPFETMQVLDTLLVSGVPLEKVKAGVGKILNAFNKSLTSYRWEKPGEGHFLHYLMLENREAEKIMNEIRSINKKIFKGEKGEQAELTSRLRQLMLKLRDYELHYIKKENILFPYIEKAFPRYHCLQIMWSFHDDYRRTLKKVNLNLDDAHPDYDLLNKEIGKLFFVILPLIFREEQIVFPVALNAIPGSSWDEMMQQSYDQGWCYIRPPEKSARASRKPEPEGLIDLGSGMLTQEQLTLILNNSPADVTFIDENDEVRYFSESKDRIFPRSRAIIGRKVQNCHPPQSLHVVNEIIAAFRRGEKDHADFWIQVKGRFLYIRYLALRNQAGEYKGTLEVSEDITRARELVNERRLLKWAEE
jgi:PAS domain S-box-containing protein